MEAIFGHAPESSWYGQAIDLYQYYKPVAVVVCMWMNSGTQGCRQPRQIHGDSWGILRKETCQECGQIKSGSIVGLVIFFFCVCSNLVVFVSLSMDQERRTARVRICMYRSV